MEFRRVLFRSPGGERDLLAEIAGTSEDLHARILAVRLAQHGKGAVAAAVVDENHFPARRDLFDDRRHPLQKEGDRLFLIIDGNDQADLRPASARGFEPAHSAALLNTSVRDPLQLKTTTTAVATRLPGRRPSPGLSRYPPVPHIPAPMTLNTQKQHTC